jgi:hypothetical protein
VQLGRISLKGENEWIIGAIEFTPQTNISSIGIGPDCTNHNFVATPYTSYNSGSMYFLDKFILQVKRIILIKPSQLSRVTYAPGILY